MHYLKLLALCILLSMCLACSPPVGGSDEIRFIEHSTAGSALITQITVEGDDTLISFSWQAENTGELDHSEKNTIEQVELPLNQFVGLNGGQQLSINQSLNINKVQIFRQRGVTTPQLSKTLWYIQAD